MIPVEMQRPPHVTSRPYECRTLDLGSQLPAHPLSGSGLNNAKSLR